MISLDNWTDLTRTILSLYVYYTIISLAKLWAIQVRKATSHARLPMSLNADHLCSTQFSFMTNFQLSVAAHKQISATNRSRRMTDID